jgi:Ca-activated chloride channel family protein
MPDETLYDRLGIPRDASVDEIRFAYRELARRLHPDRNVRAGETELFLEVQHAYETLSNPEKKKAYDSSLPEHPAIPSPIQVEVQYSRLTLTRMSDPQLIYVLLDIFPAIPDLDKPPPLNICLALDCSTSMGGVILDTVKSTAVELIRQMNPADIFALVTFSDRAEVLIPAGTKIERGIIESKIRMIQVSGGTEIYKGLEAAFNETRRHRNPAHINHIILLTDGRTYGDEQDCIRLAEQAASLGIAISVIGIGNKWNDAFLDKLAALTGGNSQYVARADEIRKFLSEKIAGLSNSLVQSISYLYHTPKEVELQYAFRLHPETDPLETHSPLMIGSLKQDSWISILLEFLVHEIPEDINELALASGRLYCATLHSSTSNISERLSLARPLSSELDTIAPPETIMQAMSKLTLYRMQERAKADLANGQVKEATRILENLATHLLSQGKHELAQTVIREISYLQNSKVLSEEGEKRIKYGTRSLLMRPKAEDVL